MRALASDDIVAPRVQRLRRGAEEPISNHIADRQGRSSRGGRGVTDVQHPLGVEYQEVVMHGAIAHDRLSTNSGFHGCKVVEFEGRTVTATFFQIALSEDRVAELR